MPAMSLVTSKTCSCGSKSKSLIETVLTPGLMSALTWRGVSSKCFARVAFKTCAIAVRSNFNHFVHLRITASIISC